MTRTFRTLQAMRKMRIEYIDDAIDDIIRIRAHNEKMLAHSVDLERMIAFGVANKEDLLEVVRAMREEDGR
jgi:hypothetical protein